MRVRQLCVITALVSICFLFSGIQALAANYTVQSGDSLYLIGNKFGVSATQVQQANGLKGTTIYPGQVLNIPDRSYRVQPGDTLFLIGQRFGVPYLEIARANALNTKAHIYPGQVLRIPSGVTASRGSTGGTVIPCTPAELDLLARLITAEADSEPYNAQVGVGAVVINRVLSAKFPNNIKGVIYEVWDGHYQFTPVLNGWINRPATASGLAAAKEALKGVDPTHESLYFYHPPITNKFLLARPVTTKIGRTVFC